MQGKLKLKYDLNTDSVNYNRNAERNRIEAHHLEGTPIPPNTNYCIGKFDKKTVFLTPLRMAVQLRTNLDHADAESEKNRRRTEKDEKMTDEIKSKVTMHIKKTMSEYEEESSELKKEKAMVQEYEREEWKQVIPHNIKCTTIQIKI